MGCPLDEVCSKGMGAGLMERHRRVKVYETLVHLSLVASFSHGDGCGGALLAGCGQWHVQDTDSPCCHLEDADWCQCCTSSGCQGHHHCPQAGQRECCGGTLQAAVCTGVGVAVTPTHTHTRAPSFMQIHGRTQRQRYTKRADWDFIRDCAEAARGPLVNDDGEECKPAAVRAGTLWCALCAIEELIQRVVDLAFALFAQLIGNGDVMSFVDWEQHLEEHNVDTCMLARGVLIKVHSETNHSSVLQCVFDSRTH